MKILVKFNGEDLTYSTCVDSYQNWFEMISLDFIYRKYIEDPCQLFLYKNDYLVDNWEIQDGDVIETIVKMPEDLLFFNPSAIYRKCNKTFHHDSQFEAIWINYINNCYHIYLISNTDKDTLLCENEREAGELLSIYNASPDIVQRLDRIIQLLEERR